MNRLLVEVGNLSFLLLSPIFYTILFMSVMSFAAGSIILLFRRVFDKKLPPFWKYFLWSIVILTMVMPLRFRTDSAIMPKMNQLQLREHSFHRAYSETQENRYAGLRENVKKQADFETKKVSKSEEYVYPDPIREKEAEKFYQKVVLLDVVLPCLWFFGGTVLLIVLLIGKIRLEYQLKRYGKRTDDYADTLKKAKTVLHIRKEVKVISTPFLNSPALTGIFYPGILLPSYAKELSEETLFYILLHELAHYKRKDLWVNTLLLGLQVIYWFNPLVWVMFRYIREDMEVLNDDYVLSFIGKENKKAYAASLVEVLGFIHGIRFMPRLLCMVDGKKEVERRLIMMKVSEQLKKYRRWIGTVVLLLLLSLGVLFFTEKKGEDGQKVLQELQNLQIEDISEIELVHYDEKEQNSKYHEFSTEEAIKFLDFLKRFQGKYVDSKKDYTRTLNTVFLRTKGGIVYTVNYDEDLELNGVHFKPEPEFLEEFLSFHRLADRPVPDNFPYETKRYRGVEMCFFGGDTDSVGFSFMEGRQRGRLQKREHSYKKEKDLLDDLVSELNQVKGEIDLIQGSLRKKAFTSEDVREFSGGRYEEGKAFLRIMDHVEGVIKKKFKEKSELVIDVYDEWIRIRVMTETPSTYLVYEELISEGDRFRIVEEKENETIASIEKEEKQEEIKDTEVSNEMLQKQREAMVLFVDSFAKISSEKDRKLTEGEINQLQPVFETMLNSKQERYEDIRINPFCHFFYGCYGDVKNMDLESFIWYMEGEMLQADKPEDLKQFEALRKLPDSPFASTEKLSATITPIQRLKREKVEEVLQNYAGLSISDLTQTDGVLYLKEFDSFYVDTSDFGINSFTIKSGEIQKGKLFLRDESSELIFREENGRWFLDSFKSLWIPENKKFMAQLGEEHQIAPWLGLNAEEQKFVFVYQLAMSYAPSGKYEVFGGNILRLTDPITNQYYEFRIENKDILTFLDSKKELVCMEEMIIKPGTKFKAIQNEN